MVKHNLKNDGAPYGDDAELINSNPKVTAGPGRALCTCGEISAELPSGKARRAWHKEHKQHVATTEQDVLADTPEDEVAEALAELVEEPKTKPAKVTKRRQAKQDNYDAHIARTKAAKAAPAEADDPTTYIEQLPFSQSGVVPGFWRSLGRDAVQHLVDSEFPTVAVTPNNNSMVLTLQGPEADVQEALQAIKDMWGEALVAVREWKKTDPAFLGRSTERLARRQEGYHLTEDFYRGFGQQYVEWRRGA